MSNADRVYLDYNATTPLAPETLEAMLPFLRDHFGNPSSIHAFGRPAKEALIESTDAFASFLGARPEELVFTSGGRRPTISRFSVLWPRAATTGVATS